MTDYAFMLAVVVSRKAVVVFAKFVFLGFRLSRNFPVFVPVICKITVLSAMSRPVLMQEDKRHADGGNPIPQLVAEAIAVFHSNNNIREQTFGLPPLPSKVIPPSAYRLNEGMKPLDNRLVILSCYEVFKQFVH
ncbi:hypothetical protein B0H12DRAFT_418087 [Mycena haematopus]|nr:hypothetical protein B0H12DRAFT_418087 [Mycena haematopus]